jgi:DUF1016 N-terminal domain
MMRFAEVFPDERIVSALRTQLGWTHFRMIIPIEDELKRDFYAEMCRIERGRTRRRLNAAAGRFSNMATACYAWSSIQRFP